MIPVYLLLDVMLCSELFLHLAYLVPGDNAQRRQVLDKDPVAALVEAALVGLGLSVGLALDPDSLLAGSELF